MILARFTEKLTGEEITVKSRVGDVLRTSIIIGSMLASTAALSLASSTAPANPQKLAQAEELYKHTDYQGSLALLVQSTTDPATNFLLGRDYFMLGDFKKSTEFLDRAVKENPKNSDYVDWLGRSYGRRAETSNPLFAPGLASKARQAFEQAVALDSRNADALSDLFDYYLDAPGFLGGGYDKAAAVAEKIAQTDPSEAFFERAKLAQKRREYDSAEHQLQAAVTATPQKISGLLTYAKFLAFQGRTRDSDAVLARAEALQPENPRLWYTRADILVHQQRDLNQAKSLLQRYLRASLTVDDPPRQDAEQLLKRASGGA